LPAVPERSSSKYLFIMGVKVWTLNTGF